MSRRLLVVAIGLLVACAGQSACLAAAADSPKGAKALFYSESGTTVAPAQEAGPAPKTAARTPRKQAASTVQQKPQTVEQAWVGISYWVEWERPGASPVRIADPARFVFQSGDRVRFHVKTNAEGYLYMMNRGSSGATAMLFPDGSMADGRNRVRAWEEYMIPQQGWIRFDNQPGQEGVFFVLSQTPLPNVMDDPALRQNFSPSVDAPRMAAFGPRGAKDLLVETDGTKGQEATYAGAAFQPSSGSPGGASVITLQTRLVHQ